MLKNERKQQEKPIFIIPTSTTFKPLDLEFHGLPKKLGEADADCIALKGVSVETAISCFKNAGVKLNDKEVFAEIKQQLLDRTSNVFLKTTLDIIVPPEEPEITISLQSIDIVSGDEIAEDILQALVNKNEPQ